MVGKAKRGQKRKAEAVKEEESVVAEKKTSSPSVKKPRAAKKVVEVQSEKAVVQKAASPKKAAVKTKSAQKKAKAVVPPKASEEPPKSPKKAAAKPPKKVVAKKKQAKKAAPKAKSAKNLPEKAAEVETPEEDSAETESSDEAVAQAEPQRNTPRAAMGTDGLLKILSWNVAGLRAFVKKNGQKIVDKRNPHIIALQETKCTEIPDEIKALDFDPHMDASAKSGYAGVMLLSKPTPLNVTCGFQAKGVDGKGRIIVAEYDKFYLINAYVPNSGRGLVNLEDRKVWDEGFLEAIKELDSKKPVIYTGDLNVAHEEIDLANPKGNQNRTAGFTDEEREGFGHLLEAGFVDVFRHLNPDKKDAYTFWSNMHGARAKNNGWRLDYFIVSERIMDKVVGCEILSEEMGSDHCPIELQITF